MIAQVAIAFIRNRYLLTLTIAVVLVSGAVALRSLPRLEDPRLVDRFSFVVTRVPGASAERVEALVTEKLERQLMEVPEVDILESNSNAGISLILIGLEDRVTEPDEIYSEIRDKLADVQPSLPEEASIPELDTRRGAVAFSFIVALTWPDDSPPQLGLLTRLAQDLGDRLRTVPGTEVVRLYGEPEEEIAVTFAPEELAALGLSAPQLAERIAAADSKRPSGVLRGRDVRQPLEVSGGFESTARIAAVPLGESPDGRLLRLGEIATVERDWRDPPRDLALVDGRRAVLVAARMDGLQQSGRWAELARAELAEFRAEVGQGIVVDELFDQSRYTDARLRQLGGNLLGGAGVVMLVILFTLGARAAVVVGVALPMTAAAALFGVLLIGGTLQQMSIFGMIIALGLLIDNAIVVVDEISSRLKRGLGSTEAVREALGQLAVPLAASTLTTVLAFAPIPLLDGNIGDFVGPIGDSVVIALIASYAIAMTLIAALAALWLRPTGRRWWTDGVSVPWLSDGFARLLRGGLRRPLVALAVACTLPALGFGLSSLLGNQFFPKVDRNMFDIQVWMPTGTPMEHTRQTVEAIGERLAEQPEVARVAWLVGGSFPSVFYNLVMSNQDSPGYARGVVETHSADTVKALIERLQDEFDVRYPTAQVVVRQFAQGPPSDAEVELEVHGPRLEVLQRLGEQVRASLYERPEVLHTRATISRGEPKVWLDLDEDDVQLAGLTLAEVAAQLDARLEGSIAGTLVEDLVELPVRVRVSEELRSTTDGVASSLIVGRAADGWIPLDSMGRLRLAPELGGITRCELVRCNKVKAYLRNGSLPLDVTRAALDELDAIGFELPPGYELVVAGESDEQGEAIQKLLTYAPVLFALMVATVVLSFRSVRLALVLFSVAFLSIGLGLLATLAGGFPFSFNSIMGTAGLIGVALNDSIVVLAAIRADRDARSGDVDAVVGAVLGCGRHVVSTTLTTIGGFLPLLVFVGGDFWPPLAIVLAGGVGGATILALVFVPAAYLLVSPRPAVVGQPVEAT